MSTLPYLLPDSYTSERPGNTCRPILFLILEAWLPVAIFIVVLAIESSAGFGSDHTSRPLHSAVQHLFGSSRQQMWLNRNWSAIHHAIRKTGHFVGYGGFALTCLRAFRLTLARSRLASSSAELILHSLAIASTFLIASLDEFHQSFLPNRTGNFRDVLLDCAGAASLQAIYHLARHLARQTSESAQPQGSGPASPLLAHDGSLVLPA